MKSKTKIISLLIVLNFIILTTLSSVQAFFVDSANIEKQYHSVGHLRYWNKDLDDWYYITTTVVKYTAPNGKKYPAYCINKELPGVGEQENYSVTVNDLLDNNEIWRVIKNGYPYKSPSQLGLENEEDAFIATKQAVYCIIYNIEPTTYYISADDVEHGGTDERGDKIKNVIVNLVNYARNNAESYSEGNFEIFKTDAKEDNINNSYISSTYTVNSNFDINQFDVSIPNEVPKGTIITDINNKEKTTFLKGEKFKILIPKSVLSNTWNKDNISWISSNINFNISVKAQLKTYPILYGKTTIPGTQNYLLTAEAFEDKEEITNFEYETKGGMVEIVKTTSDYNYWIDYNANLPLKGAKYELKRKDINKTIKMLETNKNGKFNVSRITIGGIHFTRDRSSRFIHKR